MGESGIDIETRSQLARRYARLDDPPQRIHPPPYSLAVRASRFPALPGSFYGDGHHASATSLSDAFDHVLQHRDEVGAGVTGQRDMRFRFIDRKSVTQQILPIRPVPIDRRSRDAGRLAYSQRGDGIRTLFYEELAGGFEHNCPGSRDSRIAPPVAPAAVMTVVSM